MTREELLAYCLAKPGAWPDEPWDGDVVAKVGPKIFAFTGADAVGLKLGRGRDEADEWHHCTGNLSWHLHCKSIYQRDT